MEEQIKECLVKAIREFGLENFKRTSFFLSNERRKQEVKQAA